MIPSAREVLQKHWGSIWATSVASALVFEFHRRLASAEFSWLNNAGFAELCSAKPRLRSARCLLCTTFGTPLETLLEGDDRLIDRQALARRCQQLFHHAIAFGLEHIFHFHGFNLGQDFTRLDFLSLRYRNLREQPGHG